MSYFPFELLWLPKLEHLHLEYASCINLPAELTYDYEALPDLRNYHTELLKNAYPSYQAKVITVGNGRVGKTSLLKALFQLGAFDPEEDSTHGIRLFHTTVPLPSAQADAKLMLWDFGGQELYHATHRIFMESRALYLLIWDEHTEQNLGEEEVQLQGKTYFFRNFPLSYWLGNIRALSQFAKIIVVCNKAEDEQEYFPTALLDLQSQYKITSFFSVSAKTGFHIPDLFQHIQTQLEQMHEMGMQMPLSWKKVQDQLSAIQDQPYIHFTTYHNICTEEGLSEDSAYTLLRFLHHSGFVFWHERYLNDQIVLDQKWALDAIYTLLDRNSWYKVLKGKALLKYSELAGCWSEYPEEQVELFLEIMQSCELGLKIEDKPYSHDPYYLIPEFLPDQPAPAVAQTWENAAGPVFHFRFQHHFFHSALMQRFIVRSARLAKSYDLLWRSGIMIKVEETLAHIQVYPEEGRIEMLLRGPQPRHLIERLKNEISQIQEVKGDAGFLLSLSGLPDEWIPLEQVKQGSTQVVSTSGKVLEPAPFYPLIYTPQQEEEPNPLDLKELADRESGAQLLE
jgi:internalin A